MSSRQAGSGALLAAVLSFFFILSTVLRLEVTEVSPDAHLQGVYRWPRWEAGDLSSSQSWLSPTSDTLDVSLLLWASLLSPVNGGLDWLHPKAPSVLSLSDLSYLGQDKPTSEEPAP